MISIARRGIHSLVRIAVAMTVLSLLASCSGSVSGPPQTNDPTRITILPETAILYSGLPTTFRVAGGTGLFIVSSSNQAVIHVTESVVRTGEFTVVPANVAIDTPVTLTVRDTGTAPLASATLTVRPGTVSNEIAITPSATQGGDCDPAVCSGGDAVVTATISQGGVPLPARAVRLDVVSGDFRFISSPPGTSETLATSVTVVSDQRGEILARIRALPGAANQTAVLQVTDLGTQAFQRTTFLIAQSTGTSPGFFATPDSIVFSGPNSDQCAASGSATVRVFGGTPPYSVGDAGSAFGVSPGTVGSSGGTITINALGTCVPEPGLPVTIVDAAGRTTSVTVANVRGDLDVPALVVAPEEITLGSCNAQASVSVAGGIPNVYNAVPGSDAILVTRNQGIFTVSRAPGTVATTPILVGVTSGSFSETVTVRLSGTALNTTCSSATLQVVPAVVTLASCGPVSFSVAGVPPLHAASNNSSVIVDSISPNVFQVRRTPGSAGFEGPAAITIVSTANGATGILTVLATGTGDGSGTGSCP